MAPVPAHAGRPYLFTSNAPNGTVVNQVERLYNGFGQLATEYQEHSGALTASSYKVQYVYDPADNSRLRQLVYPDGRAVWYTSDTAGAVNAISDVVGGAPATTLQTYAYLGLGTIVQRSDPQAGLSLSYLGGGGDGLAGLDGFGRVVDQDWSQGVNPVDRYQYT